MVSSRLKKHGFLMQEIEISMGWTIIILGFLFILITPIILYDQISSWDFILYIGFVMIITGLVIELFGEDMGAFIRQIIMDRKLKKEKIDKALIRQLTKKIKKSPGWLNSKLDTRAKYLLFNELSDVYLSVCIHCGNKPSIKLKPLKKKNLSEHYWSISCEYCGILAKEVPMFKK